MTNEEETTSLATTDLFDARHHIFKVKASTQLAIPLKTDAFWFTNTGDPQLNVSGRAWGVAESRRVANIIYVVFINLYPQLNKLYTFSNICCIIVLSNMLVFQV